MDIGEGLIGEQALKVRLLDKSHVGFTGEQHVPHSEIQCFLDQTGPPHPHLQILFTF